MSYARKERLSGENIHKFPVEQSHTQGQLLSSFIQAFGFTYNKEADALASRSYWECSQGKRAEFRKTFNDKVTKKNQSASEKAMRSV